jgi:hypothetical protein
VNNLSRLPELAILCTWNLAHHRTVTRWHKNAPTTEKKHRPVRASFITVVSVNERSWLLWSKLSETLDSNLNLVNGFARFNGTKC